jgi:hypothetical protein
MDSQNILNKVMSLLGVEKNVNLAGDMYGKLEDGTSVATDAFQVGNILYVITEDGNKTLAPDADHIIYLPTSNGSKRFFITTKGGVMTSIHLEDYNNSKQLNASKQNLENMENVEQLAAMPEEVKVKGPAADTKTFDEKEVVKKEEEMASEEQRLDSLEEQVNQLRVDIAQMFEAIKALDKKEGLPEEEMAKKKPQMMAAAPKFNGAPLETEPKLDGLVQRKTVDTQSRVFSRLANAKF